VSESIDQWMMYLENDPNNTLKSIYGSFNTFLVSYAMKKFSLSKEESIELSHQTIVQFYLNATENKIKNKSGTLKPYLIGILRNLSHEYIRQKSKNALIQKMPILINNTIQYDVDIDVDHRLQILKSNYSKLGDSCKELLKLFYFQNYSLTKIVSVLHYKNTDSVKTQKYKCIKKLRSLIKETKH